MLAFQSKLISSERRFVAYSKATLIAVAAIGLIASPAFGEEPEKINPDQATKPVLVKPASEWKIQIVPGPSSLGPSTPVGSPSHIAQVSFNDFETSTVDKNLVPAIEEPAPAVRRNEPRLVTPEAYREIYNSIPFSRAEYLANRDYRHAATMEILFGQLRPTKIVKTVAPATETRTSYTHQSFGRPGSISPPVWNSPMMWNSWTW